MKLSLDALQVLDAIDRKGSFAAAAASLNRVPSAISYSVQKLEQDLDIILFQKQGRRAVATKAGQLLIEQGRVLLQAAEQLSHDTQQLATGWEPRLRIVQDHCIPDHIILSAVDALYAIQPDIEVSIHKEVLGGCWEALLENRADIAIGAVDNAPSHKGLQHEAWLSVEFIFAAASGHPICEAPRPLKQETINQHRLVVIRDSSRNQPAISRGIPERKRNLYAANLEQKVSAQLNGLGVGTVPLRLIAHHLKAGRMQALPLASPIKQAPTQLAWHKGNRGKALGFILDKLRPLSGTTISE